MYVMSDERRRAKTGRPSQDIAPPPVRGSITALAGSITRRSDESVPNQNVTIAAHHATTRATALSAFTGHRTYHRRLPGRAPRSSARDPISDPTVAATLPSVARAAPA